MNDLVRRGGYKGGEGFLEIDNRASGGKLERYPTMTCAHCGKMVILNSLRTRPRGHCDRCAKYICDECAAVNDCTYYEEMIDLALAHPGSGPFLNHEPGKIDEHVKVLRDSKRIAGVGFAAPKNEDNKSE